jgi:hypothetical protein
MANNMGGTTGLVVVHNARETEFAAFDQLPSIVKDSLRESGVLFSAVGVLQLYRKIGTEQTIAQIEKMSYKAYFNTYPGIGLMMLGL